MGHEAEMLASGVRNLGSVSIFLLDLCSSFQAILTSLCLAERSETLNSNKMGSSTIASLAIFLNSLHYGDALCLDGIGIGLMVRAASYFWVEN